MQTRLNKVLARAGLTSRRGADRLIVEGHVAVNGATVAELGTVVDPDVDLVTVDGAPLPAAEPLEYILLNKPRGYVTTRSDPQGRPIVTELLRGTGARLYPVGRLDADVEGLLLLTNDGPLTHRLLHPRYGVPRVYEATVEGRVRTADLARWRAPVALDDGPARADDAQIVRVLGDTSVLLLTFSEGRKHEVKRYCERLGHRVRHLRRVAFGPLTLGVLRPGQARALTAAEVRALRAIAPLPRPMR
jgi:23S rRNA pseudouridine2605 synthase